MDRVAFERDLQRWLDGELPPERAHAMEEFTAAHPEAQARVQRERTADARIRQALLGEPAARESVRRMLERVRPGAEPARRRVLRRLGAVGAAAAVVVAAMWFACVPPFECPYLRALEEASRESKDVDLDGSAAALLASVGADADVAGASATGPPRSDYVDYDGTGIVLRSYAGPEGRFDVIVSTTRGSRPSFRRRVDRGGLTWWAAEEGGKELVAFVEPESDLLVCVVGAIPEEAAWRVAQTLRSSGR